MTFVHDRSGHLLSADYGWRPGRYNSVPAPVAIGKVCMEMERVSGVRSC